MHNLMHLSREEAEAIRALDNQASYQALVAYLVRRRTLLLDKLASASEVADIRQLQGRINELDDLLYLPNRAERVVNPNG